MNFGPFDRWVGDRFSGAVLAAMFAILILNFIDFDGSRIDFAVIASVAASDRAVREPSDVKR
jgi:hypothetical protein